MSHHGGHHYPKTKQIRLENRKRAEELQKEYAEKYPTPQAKLGNLPETGATKQRARLESLIQAEQNSKQNDKLVMEAKAAAKEESALKAEVKAEKSKKGKK